MRLPAVIRPFAWLGRAARPPVLASIVGLALGLGLLQLQSEIVRLTGIEDASVRSASGESEPSEPVHTPPPISTTSPAVDPLPEIPTPAPTELEPVLPN